MSTYWGYYCKTHDASSTKQYRNNTNALREMHRHKHAIKEVVEDIHTDVLLHIGYPEDSNDLEFLIDHIQCDLCLINEYGKQCEFTIKYYEWDELE